MEDTHEPMTPAIRPLGPDGVLVQFADALSDAGNRAALAFTSALKSAAIDGVTEVAPSLTSVLLKFDPDQIRRGALEDVLALKLGETNWYSAPLPAHRRLWTLPALFGGVHGPELEETAELAGLSADTAISEICSARLRVLALGFAPGQPYLGFLGDTWNIPRRRDVTAEVPSGAIVVAVRQVIPFANAAPTGWRQIGRTAFKCYDASRETPIALTAGDEVTFEPVNGHSFEELADDRDGFGGASFELIK